MGRAASPVEVRWRPDDKPPNLTQPARDQGRIRQSGDTQSHVEAAADEVNDLVTQMEVDYHFRIRGQKLGQDRRHMGQTKRHRRGETYPAARRLGLREGIGFGGLALVQHPRRVSQQVAADLAQNHPA